MQVYICAYIGICRYIDRRIDTDVQTERRTDKQIYRHTYKHPYIHTDTHTSIHPSYTERRAGKKTETYRHTRPTVIAESTQKLVPHI